MDRKCLIVKHRPQSISTQMGMRKLVNKSMNVPLGIHTVKAMGTCVDLLTYSKAGRGKANNKNGWRLARDAGRVLN